MRKKDGLHKGKYLMAVLFSQLSPALICRLSTRLLNCFSFQTQLCSIYPDLVMLAAK
jgi:hypothetical protein